MAWDRETSIDTLRGIALCMVICIHISAHPLTIFTSGGNYGFDFWFAHFLNSFSRVSVPLFVLISGRFLVGKHEPLKEFYKKRVSRIVLVAFFWAAFYELSTSIFWGTSSLNSSFQNILTGNTVHHLWYLYMLIGLYMLTPFIQKLRSLVSKKEFYIFGVLSLLWGMWLSAYDAMSDWQMPFLLWGLKYVWYFVFGYSIWQSQLKIPRYALLWTYILTSLCILIGTYYTLHLSGGFILYSYLTPFVVIGSLAFYWYFSNKSLQQNFFSRLSPYVLGIYLIHILFLDIFDTALSSMGFWALSWAFYILILKAITIFFASYIWVRWCVKIPYLKKLF